MTDRPPPPATLLDARHDVQPISTGRARVVGPLRGPVAEDDTPRAPRLVAGTIGVSADQLLAALRWAGVLGHVTPEDARRVMREWHDRPVMPVRRGAQVR